MNAEQLSRVGEKLVKRCGSRDPFEIARQLGINVMLCENFGSLKGMYRVIKRNRFIHGKKEKRQHHRHHAKCGKAQIPAGFE